MMPMEDDDGVRWFAIALILRASTGDFFSHMNSEGHGVRLLPIAMSLDGAWAKKWAK